MLRTGKDRVNDVKTDYAPGEAPRATATIPAADADKYEIAYECWEEMELDMESGESVPVAFWYSDPAKYTPGMKKIDHFKEGKFYMYSVELRFKGDNTVGNDCNMNVNGHWTHHIKTANGVFAPNADNMLCEQSIDEWRAIDVIELDGATTTTTTKTVERATPSRKGDAVLAATGDSAAMTVAALGIAGATVAAAGLAATKRCKR